jgi:geranylgeranyl pyrophosphate synthase
MISNAFAMLARARESFPLDRVGDLVSYAGTTLGPERLCKGQVRDLAVAKGGSSLSVDDLLELYLLKTSTLIEGALLPLLILLGRGDDEMHAMRGYADHAGIVFQIRDDLLDSEDGPEDAAVNIVRLHGLGTAYRLMDHHREAALDSCARLPFDTRLLESAVGYFATRKG